MKKYLLALILIIGAFFIGHFLDRIKKQLHKIKFNPNIGVIIIVAILCLSIGVIIGRYAKIAGNALNFYQKIGKVSLKPFIPAKATKIFVLSNFESKDDFKKWKLRESNFEQTDEYKTEGKYSGKATFFGGVQCSNILIEDYLEDNPQFGNWAGFNQLGLDIYNTSDKTERLDLKIKDASEKSWQRTMYLAPKNKTEVKIYIDELRQIINPARIIQFNLFRWQAATDAIFYIDNIRLIPKKMDDEPKEPQDENKSKKEPTNNEYERKTKKSQSFIYESQNDIFGVGVQNSLTKVFLEPEKFEGEPKDTIEISLARNEYESSQLVIYAKETIETVKIEKSDAININSKEARIPKDNIKCYVVGYVKTKKPDYTVSYVGWWPDPLEERQSFHINKNTLQPIWIQVYAPKDIPQGEYLGKITLKFGESISKDIKLKIKIWDFNLPQKTHLKTAFDFYPNRLMRMYPKKAEEDEQEYKLRISDLMNKYYLDMIKHRIMPIFNFDIQDAFFVKDIKYYLDNGLSAFAIGKYNGSSDNNWPKDPAELNNLIGVYRDYAAILKAANLIDMAYIYTYDEPKYGDPHVDEVSKMIHIADSKLKNMVCIHTLPNPDDYPEWGNDIDIWCIRNVTFNETIANKFKNMGKEIWIYVSGPNPPYPTLVIDYPAMAYRIIPWMCWKYGIKGFLYWCVNFWDENPWQNPMNTKWGQNGNGLLYYPGEKGPVTSLRLEVLRDGIEDYEYLYLLAQKVNEVETKGLEAKDRDLLNRAKMLLNIDDSIVSSMSDYTSNPKILNERRRLIGETIEELNELLLESNSTREVSVQKNSSASAYVLEDFSQAIQAINAKSFGKYGQLTFELYRNGTFSIDGKTGFAWQKSDSYRDVAIIRSTKPLPKTYKISAVVGEIDYDLSKIEGLRPDPAYEEGPMDENGCYLLAITDEAPIGHHTNDWWHKHRKICIDVDNNVWGTGMPYPIFIVYFDRNNKLMAFNGKVDRWQSSWNKAVTYDPRKWYKVEIEKTETEFICRIYDDNDNLLKSASVELKNVWHEDTEYSDYLVIGDPHENYYQGSMKIKLISMPVETQ